MKDKKIYLLLYNGSVQYAARNIKNLWVSICTMCSQINQKMPVGYEQVTRILNEHPSFVHSPCHGHAWEIVSRDVLYTKRKKKNGNTTPEELVNEDQSYNTKSLTQQPKTITQ